MMNPIERLHTVNRHLSFGLAVTTLCALLLPETSFVFVKILVCVLSGSVIADRLLHKMAINEAFEDINSR